MAGSIKGIIVEIGGDTSGLQKALSKVNSATASLSKELRGINSLLKLDPKNTTLLAQKQTVLKEEIAETTDKLEMLKATQNKFIEQSGDLGSENYRALQREIEATQIKLNKLNAENSKWNKAGDKLVEFGTNLTNISSKIENVGNNITQKLTLPILALSSAIGTAMINSAIEFESAWTGVTKTVDGTEEQMEKLKQGIKDMAEELPSSTTEISAVAEAAGQLGIETDNVLEFTKTMINMGNATNLSADEAATTLARFANVTRMSQSDFGRLGSVIVALGNNFATTESEIAQMGMNLASAGTQVGMTQPQIMALATALSSVGLEAQAGGTAFSKVMVNMQLAVEKGGKGLNDFAKVAGMTTKEFKEKFKTDATGAIMAFVDGLSKSGERGKSAIKVLDDMGITETRLRDALLRSANASEVMNKAVKLGNEAWTKNTALSEEANKRYQTLASKVEMTKNKLINLATKMGDKLTPTASKLLDKVNDLIDKFDDLSEEEALNIVKIVGMVAAIGPAITILGKLGSATGTTITTIGNLSKAIANVKNGVTVAEGQVGTFTKIIGAMTSPIGIATIAIGAMAAAYIYLSKKQNEAMEEAQKFTEKILETKKSFEEYIESVNNSANVQLTEINHISKLKNELSQLVDENGRVKEGYEGRVSFILNQLNNALGTEYSLNENIVQSYQDIMSSIDNLLAKKKAEILLEAEQQKYSEAYNQRKKAIDELSEAEENLGMTYKEATKKVKEWEDSAHEAVQNSDSDAIRTLATQRKEINVIKEKMKAYETAEQTVKIANEQMKDYEEDYALFVEGKYDEVGKKIIDTTKEWTDSTLSTIEDSIVAQKKELDKYKEIYERTGDEVAKDSYEQAQQNLKNLANELTQRTSTIENLSGEEISAWKQLAKSSFETYQEEISKMSPEMQEEVNRVTGVVKDNKSVFEATGFMARMSTSEFANNNKISQKEQEEVTATAATVNNYKGVEIATGNMAINATNTFDNNNNLAQKMQEEVTATANVENSDTSVGSGASRLGKEADRNFNSNVDGHKWGSDLVENIVSGLSGSSALGKIAGAASKVAGKIYSYLHHTVPDEGPLADEMSYMPDMIDNLTRSLLQASPKLENATADLAKKMAENLSLNGLENGISPNVISSTKTIFTTPQIVFNVQELDEGKLQQCFNYVNRKFGSKY